MDSIDLSKVGFSNEISLHSIPYSFTFTLFSMHTQLQANGPNPTHIIIIQTRRGRHTERTSSALISFLLDFNAHPRKKLHFHCFAFRIYPTLQTSSSKRNSTAQLGFSGWLAGSPHARINARRQLCSYLNRFVRLTTFCESIRNFYFPILYPVGIEHLYRFFLSLIFT
jgi:hypothetical protein